MADDEAARAFLAALQLADSTLPIGRFVHSHGLESWLEAHPTAPEAEIEEVVRSFVLEAVAPLDCAFVARAHRASTTVEDLRDLDRELTSRKTIAAARTASTACGRQLARIGPTLVEDGVLAAYCRAVGREREGGNLAVVQGALARALGIGVSEAVLVELRSAAAGLFSVAVRTGRLGPLRTQVLLARLGPGLAAAAAAAIGAGRDDLHSTAPALEIAALAHGRRDARLFST